LDRIDLRQLFMDFTMEFWTEYVAEKFGEDRYFLLQLYYDKFIWTFNYPPPFLPQNIEEHWDWLDYTLAYNLESNELVKMGVPSEHL